jgi:hypothetical protein
MGSGRGSRALRSSSSLGEFKVRTYKQRRAKRTYVFIPTRGAANVVAKRAMKVMKRVARMIMVFSELLVEQYCTNKAQASVQ